MSILNAVKIGVVAFAAYKVARGSYRFGKFLGHIAGQIETLKAAGYTDEFISTLDEEAFTATVSATVAASEKAA